MMDCTFIIAYMCAALLSGTLSAFIVILMHKWGLVELMQTRGPRLLSEMARCDFCLSFWTSLVLAAIACMVSGRPEALALPVFSCVISRYLLQ